MFLIKIFLFTFSFELFIIILFFVRVIGIGMDGWMGTDRSDTYGTGQLGDVKTPNSLPKVSSNIMHSQPALTALTITQKWTINVHKSSTSM